MNGVRPTAMEVSAFLRRLDREGIGARTVNKNRQVLSAIFSYACRADTYGLPINPVKSTDKRREKPPAALDYYRRSGRRTDLGPIPDLAASTRRTERRSREVRQDPPKAAPKGRP